MGVTKFYICSSFTYMFLLQGRFVRKNKIKFGVKPFQRSTLSRYTSNLAPPPGINPDPQNQAPPPDNPKNFLFASSQA